MVQLQSTVACPANFLRLLKEFRFNDLQFRLVHYQPLLFVCFTSAAGEKVCNFLLAVDNLSGVEAVLQNAGNGVLRPFTAALCEQALLVQHIRNAFFAVAALCVPVVNLPDGPYLVSVYSEVKVVANCFIVAKHDIRNAPFFSV